MKKWLIIGLVVVGGGYALYQNPETRAYLDRESDKILPQSVTHTTVYRWQDKKGQWQVSNTPPPAGIKYETNTYRKDTNIIPSERLTGKKPN